VVRRYRFRPGFVESHNGFNRINELNDWIAAFIEMPPTTGPRGCDVTAVGSS
jgi:hypothetical protein